MARTHDLTVGNETKVILKLALPMMAGNLFSNYIMLQIQSLLADLLVLML